MAKRFTDTDMWDQDWYIELPNKYKLLWNYIKDKCDNVGVWRPNKSILQKILAEPLNLNEFLSFVNSDKERIREMPSGRWWVKDFFIFQYGNKFSPTSPVHKGALKSLLQNGIHPREILGLEIGNLQNVDFEELTSIAYDKSYGKLLEGYGKPTERVKEKEKDKDKDILLSNSNKVKIGEKDEKKQYKQFRSSASQGADLYVERIKRGMEEMRKRNGNENIEHEGRE